MHCSLYINALFNCARFYIVNIYCSVEVLKIHTLRWHIENFRTWFAFEQAFLKKMKR